MASQAIGLIGLGLLGSALAERFLAAGTDVVGFDIEAERCANLQRLGGEVVESLVVIGRGCRRIFLSLPTSETVDKVLGEIGNHLAPGSIIIDTTTGDPKQIAVFGPRLAERGVEYLDATVGGDRVSRRGRARRLFSRGERRKHTQPAWICFRVSPNARFTWALAAAAHE